MSRASALNKPVIFIAGHNGMVGRAIMRALADNDNITILTRSSADLDLTNQAAVMDFFAQNQIDQVYLCAAKVGGIHANNTFPAAFIFDNLMIEANIINAAHIAGVKRLLFLGSSCIYPKNADQPMRESALLSGPLEPSNEPYAIAKIAGIKLCESYNRQYGCDFRSVMPTNLYGCFDNFNVQNSHVIPALIRKFFEAAQNNAASVTIWGSGNARREFLYVDDLAQACVHIMALPKQDYKAATRDMCSHINIGYGRDISIKELAKLVGQVCGFNGALKFDSSKPDGAPQKLLDISLIGALGWRPSVGLHDGLKLSYKWFSENQGQFRK